MLQTGNISLSSPEERESYEENERNEEAISTITGVTLLTLVNAAVRGSLLCSGCPHGLNPLAVSHMGLPRDQLHGIFNFLKVLTEQSHLASTLRRGSSGSSRKAASTAEGV